MSSGIGGLPGESFDYLDWRLIARAMMKVYRENEASEGTHPHRPTANSDAWCIISSLRIDIYQRARDHWIKDVGRSHLYFPYNEDEIALVYFRYRKRKDTEVDDFECEIGGAGVKHNLENWFRTLGWRLVTKAVWNVFLENEDRHRQKLSPYESRDAAWRTDGALRTDIHRRAQAHWSKSARKKLFYFPYNEDGVAQLYLWFCERTQVELGDFEHEVKPPPLVKKKREVVPEMPVDVVKEPDAVSGPWELCCKCQKPTQFWFRPKDVALCKSCASSIDEKDVPTKAEWFKQWGFRCEAGNPGDRWSGGRA